jgi:transcriptional regulator of aromatic amino acid metabolism
MSNATNGNGSIAANTDAKGILEASAAEAKQLKKAKAANTTKAVGVKIEDLEGKRDRVKYTEQIALKNPTALAEIVGNYYDDEEHDIRYWEGVVTVYLVRDGKETAIEVGTLTKQGFEMIIRDVKLLAIVDQIKKKWGYVEQVC